MSEIIQNAVFISEADLYLKSEHRHDYVSYTFKDGLVLDLDGGLDYCKRAGDLYKLLDPVERYQEMCLSTDDPFSHIAEHLLWGTRGKAGDEPLTYRPIKELAARPDGLQHMEAILKNCLNINPLHKRVVQHWLAHHEAAKTSQPT